MIRIKTRVLCVVAVVLMLSACSGKSVYGEVDPDFRINRFDQTLYAYLVKAQPDSVLAADRSLLRELGEHVIRIGNPDSAGFYERLRAYYSEPNLMRLYSEQQAVFSDIDSINRELSHGMSGLLAAFPRLVKPRISMHVSGLEQNVIVTDSLLSLSADKYMGAEYPLYFYFFEEYQRRNMTPERVVPDYLLGFMLANLPFEGNADVLLDRMIYEGKLRYVLSQLIPGREEHEFVAYSKAEYDWCKTNEARIWKLILENKHLFAPNAVTTGKYIQDAPHTAFLPAESPGRVGVWVGYRIVSEYMNRNSKTSLVDLMSLTDYQELLKQSKYKP